MTNEPYMHWHMNYIINSDIGNDSNYFNNSDIVSDTQTISLTGGISKDMWTKGVCVCVCVCACMCVCVCVFSLSPCLLY